MNNVSANVKLDIIYCENITFNNTCLFPLFLIVIIVIIVKEKILIKTIFIRFGMKYQLILCILSASYHLTHRSDS